jgi:hypothetical protein
MAGLLMRVGLPGPAGFASTVLLALMAATHSLSAQVTVAQIDTILNEHNTARCEVNPPAIHMPPLVWDWRLAQVAQSFANRGVFAHNANRNTQYRALGGVDYVGENIAASSGGFTLEQLVELWVSERANFDVLTNTCAARQQCAHYTQVVWADTLKIGCGMAPLRGGHFLVCDYAVGGNFIGQRPYQVGTGRSAGCGTTMQ